MAEFSFEVEQAGCASCAARVRGALAPLLEISTLEIDESRDAAVIVARASEEPPVEAVDELLAAASEGAGHTYRVRPGSWRLASSEG
ncbi:MAG: heavy-metal-associated domain-containing protein [Actinomycetota bacterium]